METAAHQSELALCGGPAAIKDVPSDLFTWPIITHEDEEAVLEVVRRRAMSGTDVTKEFEREFAQWQGSQFALAFHNGTAAIQAAMFACGVGRGDEIICPSVTYWASASPCFSLGATVVFADIEADSLCLDPDDIEHRITDRTRAIMVVHYHGCPADMDRILEIARKHNLKVIEDTSHAQGGLYRGRKVGTLGDVAACSLMSRKSLACGEGGVLSTNDQAIYDRAVAWGHHDRFHADIATAELQPYAGLPMGGIKGRMHQVTAAVGRVQLRHYDRRTEEIRQAIDYFWTLLEGVPGLRPHKPKDPDSNMAGCYNIRCHYLPEELEGLSITRFCEAVRAEGFRCRPGSNNPLHLHPLFNTCDIYHDGKPTRVAHSDRDLRQPVGSLPVSEGLSRRLLAIPWFKRFHRDAIEQHAAAYRKAAENYKLLLADDPGDPNEIGYWALGGQPQ